MDGSFWCCFSTFHALWLLQYEALLPSEWLYWTVSDRCQHVCCLLDHKRLVCHTECLRGLSSFHFRSHYTAKISSSTRSPATYRNSLKTLLWLGVSGTAGVTPPSWPTAQTAELVSNRLIQLCCHTSAPLHSWRSLSVYNNSALKRQQFTSDIDNVCIMYTDFIDLFITAHCPVQYCTNRPFSLHFVSFCHSLIIRMIILI